MEKSYITVVCSKVIDPKNLFSVSIYSTNFVEPRKFAIIIKSNDNESIKCEKEFEINKTQVVTLNLDLKNFVPGKYEFHVKSLSSYEFEKKATLQLKQKSNIILVQTDKSTYKPEDKIQFRVLLLDPNTKPLASDNVKIFIEDADKNRVKQFDKVELVKGVFQSELQLTDNPVLGNWNINVENNGEKMAKPIEIAKYVLPKFEVQLQSPRHILRREGRIVLTVLAKYTHGKPVDGEATVIGKSDNRYWGEGAKRVVTTVDGKATVEFDMMEELSISDYSDEETVTFDVTFIDNLTKKSAVNSTKVTVHEHKYKIEIVKGNEYCKPGFPYDAVIRVSNYDGTPVIDEINSVETTISIRYAYNQFKTIKASHKLDKFGAVKLFIELPEKTDSLTIQAFYLEIYQSTAQVKKYNTESQYYLMAKVKNESPRINQEVDVDVYSTDEIDTLNYFVVKKNQIITSDSISVGNKKQFSFKFLSTFSMIPKVKLLIYYIKSSGDIVSDSVEIEFTKEFLNNVNIGLSSDQCKPGDEVNLTVESKSNSYVGLLGIDQSVLLLKSGNDISSDDVFPEPSDSNDNDDCMPYQCYPYYRRFIYTYEREFDDAGLILLTNVHEEERKKHEEPCIRMKRCVGGGGPMLFGAPRAMAFSNEMMADAMPMMACAQPCSGNVDELIQKPLVVRKDFPETWIFDSIPDLSSGITKLSKKVPDSITSWIITGFAVHQEFGFGLTKNPTRLQVFQPFFVSTNLPYSIKRGESISIPASIFNYLEQDLKCEVFLHNEFDEFEFIDTSNEEDVVEKKCLVKRGKILSIKANSGSNVSFMIKPKKVGFITIKMTAVTPIAGDAVERQLLVEPEGTTKYVNKAFLIDLRDTSKFSTKMEIKIPLDAVQDSGKIEIAAIGDILGPTIKNIDKLIRRPYGCGEQNMLNFVPNIVVLDYLTNLKKVDPVIELKAKNFMEMGYQKELSYKHDDGSYSAFGKSDKSGSTWLTAFVVKSFNQASKYIKIEESVITKALDWLKTKQKSDGSFEETGEVYHKEMQGGSGSGITLTAYTLIAFLENKEKLDQNKETIGKAINYIVSHVKDFNDPYTLAIAAYAMQLAQHDSKNFILEKLEKLSESTNDMKFWLKSLPKEKETTCCYYETQANSLNIEMTAYGLLAFSEAKKDSESIQIMKWLVSQRNDQGGFNSTQDTVVGLQALSKLAQRICVQDNNTTIIFDTNDNVEKTINVNSENSLVLQKYELPAKTKTVSINAKGKGFAVAQVSYKFNVNDIDKGPRFIIEPTVYKAGLVNLEIQLKTSFIPDKSTKVSNMAVMEVAFPSGYTFDYDLMDSIQATEKVKRVETKNADTVAIIYFEYLNSDAVLLNVRINRAHDVTDQKPACIKVYDYYDTEKAASAFYTINDAKEPEIKVELTKL